MDASQFDRLSSALGATQNRRRALRMFGVTALGVAGASTVAQDGVDARKSKPSKKNKCKNGKFVATVTVPADGSTVTSPKLNSGQRYRLRVSGFWSTNAQFGNDAFAAFPFANPNLPELTYQGVRLGLSVNGGSPDQWGAYTAGHVYEQIITGQGQGVTFRYTDPIPADNSGSVNVRIECA